MARPFGDRLIALAALGLLLQACGQSLEPWHTVRLEQEYSADAEGVASFTDYLALEDRLFDEVDRRVVAEVPIGPEQVLVRYSRGSAADPTGWDPDWNRSFERIPAAPVGGVLLLHGMSDSPYSLRALGDALYRHGYRVVGLRLPGHGTIPTGLRHASWEDMAAATELAMVHLSAALGDRPIHLVGYSNGAALAVNYALDALEREGLDQPATLVLISPAIGISAAAGLARWKMLLARVPGLSHLDWLSIQPEFDPYRYNSFALNAGYQVHRLTRRIGERIGARTWGDNGVHFPPTLVFKSTVDATVSTDAVVDRLLSRLSPNRHELVLFDINREALKSPLLVTDPGPLTARLMDDPELPFAVTLVGNDDPNSARVIAQRKPPYTVEIADVSPLTQGWPTSVVSLSHIALPIPPEDPLYGEAAAARPDRLFLGEVAIRGERNLLTVPSDWFIRQRFNPFYDYLESATMDWMDREGRRPEQRSQ